MTGVSTDEWDDAAEEAWCIQSKSKILDYLNGQGLHHGRLGAIPAWSIVPQVSLWAIESLSSPGVVGWWLIYGDLPTDYCSSNGCRHPRRALQRIAERWQAALAETETGDEVIGTTGIPASFSAALSGRVTLLLEFAADDSLWPDDIYV